MTGSAMPPSRMAAAVPGRRVPSDFGFAGFADIFDEMFGDFMGRRRGQARPSAAAICATISKSALEDAFKGSTAQIRVPTSVGCDMQGQRQRGRRGGRSPARPAAAQGKVRAQQGFFTIERTCPSCGGAGA
jgi:molecular chaperone DnaJ